MDIMMGMSANAFVIALVQIIAIDIVLGGDNAIIIALACRNLPPKQKRLGILWGTAGAITLRVILVFFASTLMTTPGLRLIGGVLLLWIGIKLLTDQADDDLEGKIAEKGSLLGAIQTIIIADFVMSLDNSIAIAAAAKGNMYLVVFGLVLSVPIIIAGSAIILKLMSRFPVIISMGAPMACLASYSAAPIARDLLLRRLLTFLAKEASASFLCAASCPLASAAAVRCRASSSACRTVCIGAIERCAIDQCRALGQECSPKVDAKG